MERFSRPKSLGWLKRPSTNFYQRIHEYCVGQQHPEHLSCPEERSLRRIGCPDRRSPVCEFALSYSLIRRPQSKGSLLRPSLRSFAALRMTVARNLIVQHANDQHTNTPIHQKQPEGWLSTKEERWSVSENKFQHLRFQALLQAFIAQEAVVQGGQLNGDKRFERHAKQGVQEHELIGRTGA
jgi:hypothetical protein